MSKLLKIVKNIAKNKDFYQNFSNISKKHATLNLFLSELQL